LELPPDIERKFLFANAGMYSISAPQLHEFQPAGAHAPMASRLQVTFFQHHFS